MLIVDDDAARRLARAILADVALYGGADDSKAIGEARQLFDERVSASLHHVFEEERRALSGPARTGSAGPTVERGPTRVTVTDGAGLGGPAVLSVGLALLVLVAAAATAFFLAR